MAIYSPKGNGMKRLEELDYVAITTLGKLKNNGFSIGSIAGPVQVLSGDDPLALSNVSTTFHAVSSTSGPAPYVDHLFGREGPIVAQEGDYVMAELSDVSSKPPAPGELMEWNGSAWEPAPNVDSEAF